MHNKQARNFRKKNAIPRRPSHHPTYPPSPLLSILPHDTTLHDPTIPCPARIPQRFDTRPRLQPSSGTVLAKHELASLGQHASRDVAALAFKDEDRAISDIRSSGIPFSPLPLRQRSLGEAEALQIVGYEVRELPGSEKGEDPGMVMVRARGELAARTAKQAFVGTDHATLNPGMCGGAVLDECLELCGCVEGVVPTAPAGAEVADEQVRALQGMPCVVEWHDLDTLLRATMDAVGNNE